MSALEEEIHFDDEEPRGLKRDRPAYSVIHEDERIVVFDKASGVSTIPERFEKGGSLKELAEEKFGRLWTVHRIDKGTSGLVIFGRDAEAHKSLNDQFESRETGKLYAAVVEGEMIKDEMQVDIPLASDPAKPGRMRASARGKESLTILRVRERYRGFTYIEAEPQTGRTHQIRVHCKAVGLPLLVDAMYGNHTEFLLSSIKRKFKDYGREERPLVDRLTLHAERLTLRHPGTGENVTFEAQLPRDLKALVTQMRKARGRIEN